MSDDRCDWNKLISYLFWMTRRHETAPAIALTVKLAEEVGEFSEVMLHELGFLKHKNKEWKDTPAEEAADIINVLISTLSVHYPDKTPGELCDELFAAVQKKGAKYARLLGAEKDVSTG